MKRFCFDNSGFSNPYQNMPEYIPHYQPIWNEVRQTILSGIIGTTKEIYDEMCLIEGDLGNCIKNNQDAILLEVGDVGWNFDRYLAEFNRMRTVHEEYISEYSHSNSRRTICLNDLTVIALAKTLNVPVVSEESSAAKSDRHRRIPDICDAENVDHLYFNDFLVAIRSH
ncbi:DUF4411 family protein [uncultured Sneathiella sp.]|uniref:DUF4411 family protein n=1 Tax=uncultured Sneathiella sp. TaxID=879315 RepID=UPI002599E9C2|nr:DUF4411 family protein [uncultured Sneathiella sp.]